MSASLDELEDAFGSADYYLLSSTGITRSITKEWRYLPATFAGLSMLLQHYKVDSALGTTLQAVIEHLQLELGVNDCPLHYDFQVWGILATDSWVKFLWGKIDKFGIGVVLAYDSIPAPRRNDIPIMQQWFVDNGIRGDDLRRLNRVRKAHEALFLSDIATASGRRIEKHLAKMEWRDSEDILQGRHRSTLPYSPEYSTDADMKLWLWKRTLHNFAPNLLLIDRRLGEWTATSTRKWRYLWHEETCTIEEHREHTIAHFRQGPNDRAGAYSFSSQSNTPLRDTVPVDIALRGQENQSYWIQVLERRRE